MRKIKSFFVIGVACFLCVSNTALALDALPGFNPNKIIEDKVFADTQTFVGPEGIQKFLESKGSILANTSPDFLVKLKEPTNVLLKQGLEDPQPSLGRLRTAAELIWDASKQSGINPQVLLVTLQKEQGLITNHQNDTPDRIQRALDFAFGFNCPDATGCSQNSLFPGFYFQLFGNFDTENNRYLGAAKSLMKSFNTPGGRGPAVNGIAAKVGDVVSIDNTTDPYNVPASQMVTIGNNATAALYRFTPHVFNGNYNFWKFFTEWFKYPNGTLIRVGQDQSIFIIQNGSRLLLPSFVAQNRGLDLTTAINVSPNELEDYPAGTVYGPADNTIVQVAGDVQKYVFINNIKHLASDFVLQQRKLDPTKVLTIQSSEAQLFQAGDVLTPTDGTVLKGQSDAGIYLVDGGKLKLFSEYTFKQRKVTNVQVIADTEIASYTKQGFVAPLDNTLVKAKSNGTVYLIASGLKHPISGEVFKSRHFSYKSVVVLSDDEVNSLPLDGYAQPGDKTFFKVAGTGAQYIFKEGSKHAISSFVAKQRGISPDYTFTQDEASSWSDGIPVAPKDNALVKGSSDGTIYLVVKGQLRGLTATAFKARRLSLKKVVTLPQAEVDGYVKGEVLNK